MNNATTLHTLSTLPFYSSLITNDISPRIGVQCGQPLLSAKIALKLVARSHISEMIPPFYLVFTNPPTCNPPSIAAFTNDFHE